MRVCGLPVLPEDLVLLGGYVVCGCCRVEVHVSLSDPEFPEDWPSDDQVAASVRRRVANLRAEAAMRLQGVMAL